jgi:GT2 family glycosyltransferase
MMYLNNDTELRPGCIEALVGFMDSHPRAGAISGKVCNPDGSDQGVARKFPSLMNGIFGRRSLLTRMFPHNPWAKRYMVCLHRTDEEPFEVDILSAACMVVRTDQAKAMGGFDESFTLYWVDAEMCGRLKRLGFTIWCVPRAQIMHYEGLGGSTATLRRRVRMTIAFNRDAYLAYWKYKGYGLAHPMRWIAAGVLALRTAVLVVMQLLRPNRATSSVVRNVPAGGARA